MIEYDLWPWKHEIFHRFPGALRLCLPWSEREKTLSFFVSELRQPQRMQSTGALRAAQLLSFTGRQRYTSPRRNGPGGCQRYTVRHSASDSSVIGQLVNWSSQSLSTHQGVKVVGSSQRVNWTAWNLRSSLFAEKTQCLHLLQGPLFTPIKSAM